MEKIKNFLVAFLSLTMCLLCFATLVVMSGDRYDMPDWLAGTDEYSEIASEKTSYKIMAVPYRISAVSNEGIYTEQGVSQSSQLFKDCEKLLVEAVGSMEELTECTSEAYREALSGRSLHISLNGRLPVYLLQMWSGNGSGYDMETGMIALVRETKGVKVYFRDENTGKYYGAQTSSSNAVIDEMIDSHAGSNGLFLTDAIDIYGDTQVSILSQNQAKYKTYTINEEQVSFDEKREESLLRAFGLNPYFAKNYQEPEGDKVYVEEDNVLSLGNDGKVTYRSSGAGIPLSEEGTALSEQEKAALAADKLGEAAGILYQDNQSFSAEIISVESVEGEIHIGGIVKIDGIPVSEELCSAGIIVNGDSITRMWIDLPNISESGEITVMSDVMALGLHKDTQGTYELVYTVDNGTLIPQNCCVKR